MPSEVRYAEARRMLEAKGYFLNRIKGSHHNFVKAGVRSLSLPVHHGKVKYVYVRKIQNLP